MSTFTDVGCHIKASSPPRREYFARARKAVLSDPFPPDLRLRFEEAMDRVDDLLARLGHRPLPREKYRWPIRMSKSSSQIRDY